MMRSQFERAIALVFLALFSFATATSTAYHSACSKLASTTSITIEWPVTPAYQQEQAVYWSASCRALTPTCILFPKSAKEVSTIVKVLQRTKEKFAIKSGGHNANEGFSSILGGPTISLREIKHVTYDAASNLATIGTGNRWANVARELQKYGVAVASGRVGHVGVGGYLTGGGLSYLSTQHGWAVNTVKEYEIVLASGEIVTASAKKNSDLFYVLKGGSNNFGIVTSAKLEAFPTGTIWGGQLIFFGAETANALLPVIRNFTEFYPTPKAAFTVSSLFNTTDNSTLTVAFLFYDGPTPPPTLFAEFFALAPILNTWSPTNYSTFIDTLGSSILTSESVQILTESTPLPSHQFGQEVLGGLFNKAIATTVPYSSKIPGLNIFQTWQPIPRRLAAISAAKGGDLISLQQDKDLIMFETHLTYASPASDDAATELVKKLHRGYKTGVEQFQKEGKLEKGVRLPLFANDIHWTQDYWGRVRKEDREKAKRVQRRVDRDGFWKRTGGLKLR